MGPKILWFKSYLKILDIPYFLEDTNFSVISDIIERVIKSTHIFDNIALTFYPQVIKVSSKFNIAMIWVDIWNLQNGTKAKCLINRCFNLDYYIAIIKETNMKPYVL